MNKRVVFIFRRDLRLEDNTALHEALSYHPHTFCFFILDPVQCSPAQNSFFSHRACAFMLGALEDLAMRIQSYGGQLTIMHGNTEDIVSHIVLALMPTDLYVNADYTPFSRERDQTIATLCSKHGVQFHVLHDALLIGDPVQVLTKKKTPYSVFTPFYKAARNISYRETNVNRSQIATMVALPSDAKTSLARWILPVAELFRLLPGYLQLVSPVYKGTHANAQEILKNTLRVGQDYQGTHDIPSIATTHLSPYLKFGLLSVRTVCTTIAAKYGMAHPLIRQLYWRDFFTYVAFHSPHVFGHAYHQEFDALEWDNNQEYFDRWCSGTTGFPLVDAGMRELAATGHLHNRVRMVVASFLCKDLHIDWRYGERYFAQKLVDYDPAVNNGNWQWVASTGCDAQPYFRIFNPWLQQRRFDPEGIYIRKWIPELASVSNRDLHNWHTAYAKYPLVYHKPICWHEQERSKTMIYYKQALKKAD